MAETSLIEWTEATWSPITGCTVVSPGCTNCYAMKLAGTRLQHHPSRVGLTRDTKAGPVWTGEVRLNEEWLTQPLTWKRPRMIFVCAHGDLFHESVPDEWIDRVFAVMALASHHVFQVLTKRSKRMREYLSKGERRRLSAWSTAFVPGTFRYSQAEMDARLNPHASSELRALYRAKKLTWPLPNVWLGVSAEDQRRADERIPDLLATPAAVRWVSAEPLLGPIDFTWITEPDDSKDGVIDALLGCNWIDGGGRGVIYRPSRPGHEGREMTRYMCSSDEEILANRKLDWVIVGGESGLGARPMHPDWARSIRDQCAAAGVPFFFKQWGEWVGGDYNGDLSAATVKGKAGEKCQLHDFGRGAFAAKVGKKVAGRLLDGREHNEMPRAFS